MEPVTHMLTGAVLARAGFNRRALYATAAMVVAAELPDIDTLWAIRGPVESFEHHRGITHTFVAIPFEAALVVGLCYLVYRLRARSDGGEASAMKRKAPANWLWLYAGALLALLSHILLDWTNNYGVRPFFPFNPRWYAGSFVFIFEPVLFGILLLTLVLPWLFGLINSEVGARRRPFASPVWSYIGLVMIAALYVFRFNEHTKALRLAEENAPADATRFFASPHPTNPYLWSTMAETQSAYQLATVNTSTGEVSPPRPSDTLYKPPTTLALLAAKRTTLGKVYLDWSSWPVLAETPDTSDPNHPLTLVTFMDARFLYSTTLMNGRAHAPLTGTVLLDMQAPERERTVETRMDGRVER